MDHECFGLGGKREFLRKGLGSSCMSESQMVEMMLEVEALREIYSKDARRMSVYISS